MEKYNMTTEQKIELICLLISTICIIVVVALSKEFTVFWKVFSLCIFVQWLSLSERIRKTNSKKRDNQDEKIESKEE